MNSSRESENSKLSVPSPWPEPPSPPLPAPDSGRATRSPWLNVRLPGWTISRSPPRPCLNPGSEMSFTGMRTSPPFSMSLIERSETMPSIARFTWSL